MQKTQLTQLAIYATALMVAAISCANAITGPVASNSMGSDMNSFQSMFGTPIVQGAAPLPMAAIDSAPPTVRLRTVQQIATANGLTWEKVYHVSPASADRPVTTMAEAEQMVDQRGLVSLSVTDLPAYGAIKRIAAADNATVDFSDELRLGSIDANLTDDTVAQAVAALAHRTHTHWWAEYVLGPIAVQTPESNQPIAARVPLNQQEFEETQLFNGPIIVHVAPPPPEPTVPASTVAAAAANGASQQATKDVAAAAAANAPQQPNPYNPYYMTPPPYQIAPGMTVEPGNPWGDSSIVMGGSNSVAF